MKMLIRNFEMARRGKEQAVEMSDPFMNYCYVSTPIK